MALKDIESRLDRFFNRASARSFGSGIHPFEIAKRLGRELDLNIRMMASESIIPNDVSVFLSNEDAQAFSGFESSLIDELNKSVRDHAAMNGLNFVGPVSVAIFVDDALSSGDLAFRLNFIAGSSQPRLIDAYGTAYPLSGMPIVVGRTGDADVVVADANVSRRHCEFVATPQGVVVRDLGSTNGTYVNGARVESVVVTPSDSVTIGSMQFRIEMA